MDRIVKEKEASDELRQQWFDTFKTTDDHLMHLVGTAKDQNGNLYYITKNSWADDSNSNGGMLYMSRNFVELKTTAIQIHKDVIPADLKKKLGIE
jgi:bleomycin hydrolase